MFDPPQRPPSFPAILSMPQGPHDVGGGARGAPIKTGGPWGPPLKLGPMGPKNQKFEKKSMKKCFDPINVDDFSRRFSLCQRFLHISHQMMSYIDFSNFHFFNFFQFRAMKLPLRPPCRANFFASFGPVYSLIGPIWTDFIKNPKIINNILI